MTFTPQTYTYIFYMPYLLFVHVVSKHLATDKLTTANGGTFTLRSAVSAANHVRARQSLIECAVT